MPVIQWIAALRFTSVKETLGHANIATTGRYDQLIVLACIWTRKSACLWCGLNW
nr:hypothetical protein [Aliterella atlantica]